MLKKNLAQPSSPLQNVMNVANSKRQPAGKTSALTALLLSLTIWLSPNAAAEEDLSQAKRAIRLQDYNLAFQLYKNAADSGDGEAQYQLANLYQQGLGVEQNDQLALELLEQSSAQENAAAQYTLAMKKMEHNPSEAMKLVNLAAEQGYAAANIFIEKKNSQPDLPVTDRKTLLGLWFGNARTDRIGEMQRLLDAIGDIEVVDQDGQSALNIAAEFQNTEIVSWLLDHGANPDHRDNHHNSPVFVAAARNNGELVRLLMDNGADKNQTLPNGDNLLHFSVRLGQAELLLDLINYGVPMHELNLEGWTPLDLAMLSDNEKLTESLNRHNARHSHNWLQLTQQDTFERQVTQFGETMRSSPADIVSAAKIVVSGNAKLLHSVLQRHPELVFAQMDDSSTLLSLAVKNGMPEIITTLLDAGADANFPIYGNITPLQIAVRRGEPKIVNFLLQAGGNPLIKDQDDWDSMDWAVTEKREESGIAVINWLLNNSQYSNESIPFDHYLLAASQHDLVQLAGLLLPHTENEEFDQSHRNALWFAANNGNALLVDQLLRAGISPVAEDSQGRTAFYIAVRSDCLACARLLLGYSDINQQALSGVTPLMAAAVDGKTELMSWLLENNANVELRNSQGNTALIAAVEADAVPVVRLLLDAGVNVTRKNNLGYSALDIAKGKNPELHALMKEHTVFSFF
ncbi:MAG: ankyrin repeat domain-containing protein [Gammaproteobacteria bacterium]|nr:ankyrin repeat domain-containing protein [Gammaproteobacteria bacterium]